MAIGASDTVGIGASDPKTGSWPARVASLLPAGSTYRNLGVSGSLASQAALEQLPAALEERPTVVTVWLAVNDINALVSPSSYARSLATILDTLMRQTDARIFVGNVPDLSSVPVYGSLDPEVIRAAVFAYNTAIASAAARGGGRVVLVDLFSGSSELATSVTVSSDGFHPSDEGYRLIAERFAAAMRGSGIPLRER